MRTKKLTKMAMLLTLALIIFIIESFIPPLAPIPGIKLGLANIITLVAIYMLGRREAFIILILRIILASVFAGGMAGFLYSLAGGVLCFICMALISRITSEKQIWAVSITGAIGHNTGQIIVACIVIGNMSVLWYLPVLIISAVLTGLFTGLAAQFTVKHIKKVT